jgi:hypothetical protein
MHPFRAWPLLLLLAVASGCHKTKALKPPVPPLPVVAISDISPPSEKEVLLKSGMTIANVADNAYGHWRFSGVVATHNHIADETRIRANSIIKTPSLPVLFQQDGLDPRYQPAVNALAWAAQKFREVLPAYLEVRGSSRSERIVLPTHIRTSLTQIADAIEAASAALEKVTTPHQPPLKAIGNLQSAAGQVQDLAAGITDGAYHYDYDMVGQRLGLGTSYLLIWVHQHHQ